MNQSNAINSPLQIKISEWYKILTRVVERVGDDNISIAAAGVAFYIFLAIFPALIAIISIYGLTLSPQITEEQIRLLSRLLPMEAYVIIARRVENLSATSGQTLGWGMVIGFLVSLWSANTGTMSLFNGLDMAYGNKNDRGILKQNAYTLIFTIGAFILLVISMMLIVIYPAIEWPGYIGWLVSLLRWPFLAFIVITGLSLLYKYAPDREFPKFRWVIPSAFFATLLWLTASWGFSFFVSNFGRYGEIYGSISAVVILLLWLYISTYIVLLGGQFNSVTEEFAKPPDRS